MDENFGNFFGDAVMNEKHWIFVKKA